jgi:hypothetical protein
MTHGTKKMSKLCISKILLFDSDETLLEQVGDTKQLRISHSMVLRVGSQN